MNIRRLAALGTALIGLTGCSFIPDYHRPALPVAAQYPVADSGAKGPAAANLGWRDFFTDPALQQLIALSLQNNRDLRVSILNVQAAQAQYLSSRASLFPTLDATAGLDRTHTPAGMDFSQGSTSAASDLREYSLGVGAVSWELDLFGNIRSKAKAAQETYLSDVYARQSAQISLVAEVASAYFTWLADRESLTIAQNTAADQTASLKLVRMELQHGTATALDEAQAETTLDTANANVAAYTRQVAQDMDQLVLLVGTTLPPDLLGRMNAVAGLQAEPGLQSLPAGLPSDLLERRPDIMAAEHMLLAANANVGAARSAFFPQITITANGGTASSGLQHLFGAATGAWLFQPDITVPIFAGGQNLANLDYAKVEKRIEVANYEKTIQSAFHDVSDALNARDTYVSQVAAEQALVDADRRYYQLAGMRFQTGIDNYLNVLVADNSLLSARLTLVSLQLAALQNSITLYKALGGGWLEHSGGA
ncbi:efflux transporter outer membrane subunit [Acidocella aromatica]|uniref:Multidrug efflux system outer membrane protein n=1 Tax=Acidocella aromatica TaxID=1303579 RepID=A0A840VL73_9PROT|nr:efflux transporter outer membrane subunit [Acidocella aromatica]MBB5372220.1 multidrug efflux system outer membrane protein [Acidocella aromatica]